MLGSDAHRARITCQFSTLGGGRATLDQIEIVADTHTCRIAFSWSWAAASVLRQDVLDYLTGVAGMCFPADSTDDEVSIPNLLGTLPGLAFENLTALRGRDGAFDLQLHARFQNTSAFFEEPKHEKIGSALEDVFLPLTNLSAYLTAMTEQADQDGPNQALTLTAHRIDEFLTMYGDRLQNGEADRVQLVQRPKG